MWTCLGTSPDWRARSRSPGKCAFDKKKNEKRQRRDTPTWMRFGWCWTKRCDDPGGLCAADQSSREWSDEGERGWHSAERGGVERESVRARSSVLFLLLTDYTKAPPNRIGLQPPRWKRHEWCSPTFNTVRSASSACRVPGDECGAHREQGGPLPETTAIWPYRRHVQLQNGFISDLYLLVLKQKRLHMCCQVTQSKLTKCRFFIFTYTPLQSFNQSTHFFYPRLLNHMVTIMFGIYAK